MSTTSSRLRRLSTALMRSLGAGRGLGVGATAAAMAVTSGGLLALAVMVTWQRQPPEPAQLVMLIFLAASPLLPFLAQLGPAGRMELAAPTSWLPITQREADAALLIARAGTATLGAAIVFGAVGTLAVAGGLVAFFLTAPGSLSAANVGLALGFGLAASVGLALSYGSLALAGSWLLLPVWLAEGRDTPGARLPGPLLLGWVGLTAAVAATPGGLWVLPLLPVAGLWIVDRLGIRPWRLPWADGARRVQTRPWWIGGWAVAMRACRGAIAAVLVGALVHALMLQIEAQAGARGVGPDVDGLAVVVVAVLVPTSVMITSTLPTPPWFRPWPVPGLPPPDLRYLEHLPMGRRELVSTRAIELSAGVLMGMAAIEITAWLLGISALPAPRPALALLLLGLQVPSLAAWGIAARWPSWRSPLAFASLAVLALIAVGLSLTPVASGTWLVTGRLDLTLAAAALMLGGWSALSLRLAWRALPGR